MWKWGQAIQLWDIGTVDMHGNDLTNNYQGVFIYGGGGGVGGGPYAVPSGSISGNNIVGNNQYGINVDPNATGGPLSAEYNWWGNVSGPYHGTTNPNGIGDKVSDNVKYSPWCAADDNNPGVPGYQKPTPMTWGVSTNGTIQEAITEASSGDTIQVVAGTYQEHLTINKSLTLQGKAGATVDGSGSGHGVAISASSVTVSGFTVQNDHTGIYVDGASATISNNILVNNAYCGIHVTSRGKGSIIKYNRITGSQ